MGDTAGRADRALPPAVDPDYEPEYEPVVLPVADSTDWISEADGFECKNPERFVVDPHLGYGVSTFVNADSVLGWVSYPPQILVDPQDTERDVLSQQVFSTSLLSSGEVNGDREDLTGLRVRFEPDLLAVAVAESGRGATVHLLVSTPYVYLAASERPDGTWLLVAPCRGDQFDMFFTPWMDQQGIADYGALAKLLYEDPAAIARHAEFAYGYGDWYSPP